MQGNIQPHELITEQIFLLLRRNLSQLCSGKFNTKLFHVWKGEDNNMAKKKIGILNFLSFNDYFL